MQVVHVFLNLLSSLTFEFQGAETQSRIQNSTVLLCGLRGLNTEVVKNVVLAGVNVVVQDSTQFEASDLSYSYLCGNEKEGVNVISKTINKNISL